MRVAVVGRFFLFFFFFLLRVWARFVKDSAFLAFDVLGLVLAPVERQSESQTIPDSELGPQFREVKSPSWAECLERQEWGEDCFALLGLIKY